MAPPFGLKKRSIFIYRAHFALQKSTIQLRSNEISLIWYWLSNRKLQEPRGQFLSWPLLSESWICHLEWRSNKESEAGISKQRRNKTCTCMGLSFSVAIVLFVLHRCRICDSDQLQDLVRDGEHRTWRSDVTVTHQPWRHCGTHLPRFRRLFSC